MDTMQMGVEHELSKKRIERNVLETERTSDELADDEEYQTLQQEIEALEARLADDDGDAVERSDSIKAEASGTTAPESDASERNGNGRSGNRTDAGGREGSDSSWITPGADP